VPVPHGQRRLFVASPVTTPVVESGAELAVAVPGGLDFCDVAWRVFLCQAQFHTAPTTRVVQPIAHCRIGLFLHRIGLFLHQGAASRRSPAAGGARAPSSPGQPGMRRQSRPQLAKTDRAVRGRRDLADAADATHRLVHS
jgi:hypothetical protein